MAETSHPRDVPGLVGCGLAVVLAGLALANSGEFSPLGSVFPRTIAGLMIVLALMYAVVAFQARSKPRVAEAGSNPRRLGTMAVLLAWAFLLQPLGFLFTSACASLLLLLLAQHERWTPRAALLQGASVLLVLAALYGLFRFALLVPLPVGVFW
jgi:putative tricarboxylic transport membrane protein